jgi:hypothetical protein
MGSIKDGKHKEHLLRDAASEKTLANIDRLQVITLLMLNMFEEGERRSTLIV